MSAWISHTTRGLAHRMIVMRGGVFEPIKVVCCARSQPVQYELYESERTSQSWVRSRLGTRCLQGPKTERHLLFCILRWTISVRRLVTGSYLRTGVRVGFIHVRRSPCVPGFRFRSSSAHSCHDHQSQTPNRRRDCAYLKDIRVGDSRRTTRRCRGREGC